MINNRFVLIDAFALIFRAYYALPPSMTTDGHSVHAAYGFASALLSAIRTLEPEYLAVGMDHPKPTKRHTDFAEYKAHRAPAPEDLVAQIPYVKDVLKTMNIPVFSVEGYEGEDILATIVANVKAQMSNDKFEYILVTGDMDLLQLIDEQTKVYSMARGVNQAAMYDTEMVKERYGLSPAQFVDFKALKGDASDNIPGVKGIGEKGASKLIQEFGSLDEIYEEISKLKLKITNECQNDKKEKKIQEKGKISDKLVQLLSDNKEQAYLSQKLSKIVDDAPLDFNLADAKIHEYDQEKTITLFKELNFKSLIDRLPKENKPDLQGTLF